jgi:glutathione peroxidase
MKKTSIILMVTFFMSLATYGQNYFDLSFTNTNGESISVNSLAGKKTLFLILPLSQNDSNFNQLQSFKNRYLDTVRIVGVLSYEAGYQNSNAATIQSLYTSMGIIVTGGMYTKKSSGPDQSELMKWLTDKTKNRHFDMDATGIGHKFFVNESGRLYAVLPPQTALSATIIDKIVHSGSQ